MFGQDPESSEQRRARYLKMAAEARAFAAKSAIAEVQDAYLTLAKSWTALADGIASTDAKNVESDEYPARGQTPEEGKPAARGLRHGQRLYV